MLMWKNGGLVIESGHLAKSPWQLRCRYRRYCIWTFLIERLVVECEFHVAVLLKSFSKMEPLWITSNRRWLLLSQNALLVTSLKYAIGHSPSIGTETWLRVYGWLWWIKYCSWLKLCRNIFIYELSQLWKEIPAS